MLVDKQDINIQEFKKLFVKKFSNFIEKCPLYVVYSLTENTVNIIDISINELERRFHYDLLYNISVKENIKNIKQYLMNQFYPTFEIVKTTKRFPTTFEIKSRMESEKISFKEASHLIEETSNVYNYRIEKVINQDNRLVIRDLDSNVLSLYQFNIPVILFLKEVFYSKFETQKLFVEKSTFIKNIKESNTP